MPYISQSAAEELFKLLEEMGSYDEFEDIEEHNPNLATALEELAEIANK